MINVELKDLLTGELFIPKRRNQKFASAKNRIDYNNLKAAKEREAKAFIEQPLQINHRLLIENIKPKETKVLSRDFLSAQGFIFFLLTHYQKYGEKICPALYDFIFLDFDECKPTLTVYRS